MSDLISSSSLSSLYSVAIETLCFVIFFLVALRYKQWKQSDDGKQRPAQSQQCGTPLKAARPGTGKAASSFKNRKAGTNAMARGYLSGESTDASTSVGSLRSSDTEVSSADFVGEACPVWLSASNAQQLGFIQYPQAFMMTGALDQNAFYNNAMSLSSYAEPFVPTSGTNAGYGNAGQKQEWGYRPEMSAESEAPWAHLDTMQGEYPSSKSHSDLAAVISKLNPQDAATVLASLNAASPMDATAKTMGVGVPVVLYPRPVAMPQSSGAQWESNRQRASPQNRNKGQPPQRPLPKEVDEGCTLKDNLRELSVLDPRCVLLVRKISKLGLNSPQLLEIYFSQFGPVERVFISHSIEKPQGRRSQPRWRPAGLGFIAMKNPEDADAARARGTEQVLLDVTITVGSYEDHFTAKSAAAAEASAEVADDVE